MNTARPLRWALMLLALVLLPSTTTLAGRYQTIYKRTQGPTAVDLGEPSVGPALSSKLETKLQRAKPDKYRLITTETHYLGNKVTETYRNATSFKAIAGRHDSKVLLVNFDKSGMNEPAVYSFNKTGPRLLRELSPTGAPKVTDPGQIARIMNNKNVIQTRRSPTPKRLGWQLEVRVVEEQNKGKTQAVPYLVHYEGSKVKEISTFKEWGDSTRLDKLKDKK